MLKKTVYLFAIILLACFLISGCVMEVSSPSTEPSSSPETTPESTTTPEPSTTVEITSTPEAGSEADILSITVEKEHMEASEGTYEYDIYIPSFIVTGSDTLLDYLNEEVREGMLEIVDRFADWSAANPPDGVSGLNSISLDFETSLNDGETLSIYTLASTYMGGASTDNFSFTYNIDVLDQEHLSMDSLLGGDYEPITSALIKNALSHDYFDAPATYNLLNVGMVSQFTGTSNPSFYLTPTHMGFIYNKYSIFPGAYGALRTEVPLSFLPEPAGEALAEINPAFCIAFNPATGEITFDYVQILIGDDAVAALAEDEDISEAEAHDRIYDHDPNEYIRNQNAQLRTFAIDENTCIIMINLADGTVMPEGYYLPYTEFVDLYAANPNTVVGEYQLYSVTVAEGNILTLEQIYRP